MLSVLTSGGRSAAATWALVKADDILPCESIPALVAARRANSRSRSLKSPELCWSGQREEEILAHSCRGRLSGHRGSRRPQDRASALRWLCRRRRGSWGARGRRHHRLRGCRAAALLRSRTLLWLLWPGRPWLLLYPSAGVGPVHRRLPAWSAGARLPVTLAPFAVDRLAPTREALPFKSKIRLEADVGKLTPYGQKI
jgi:hypothetical protein